VVVVTGCIAGQGRSPSPAAVRPATTLSAPVGASAPDPALAALRYGVEPRVEFTAIERRAMDVAAPLLQRPGDPPPARSGVLALAARQLATLAASGDPAPLDRVQVRSALWNAAASDPAPLAYLVSGPPHRVAEALPSVIAARSFAGHLGAGVVERDGTAWLVLLASPRRARLNPFPRAVAVGASAVLEGELVTGLADPRLFVTAPDGSVGERPISGSRRFTASLRFDSPGRWLVEVLGRGLNGPEVVGLLAVSAGPEAAAPPHGHAAGPDPADPAEAEARVLVAINATRGRHGLPPLEPSARLKSVARAHSAEMLRQGLLAHILPGSGDIGERLRRAGIPFRKALENLAKGQTALAAHEATEESPAHRDNLLVAGPTLAGVGIARATLPGGGPVVYLTEVFVEPLHEAARNHGDPGTATRLGRGPEAR
jgi:uncharacterized protein YkwD